MGPAHGERGGDQGARTSREELEATRSVVRRVLRERREQQRVVMATAPVEVPVVGKSRKKRSRPGARVANTTSWKRMSYRATVVHADAPEQPPMRFKTSVRKTKAQSAADRRAGRELQRRAALRLKFSSTGRTEPEGPAAVRARNRTFVA